MNDGTTAPEGFTAANVWLASSCTFAPGRRDTAARDVALDKRRIGARSIDALVAARPEQRCKLFHELVALAVKASKSMVTVLPSGGVTRTTSGPSIGSRTDMPSVFHGSFTPR